MYDIRFSKKFEKDIKKLNNSDIAKLYKKILEIQNTIDINRYKNLRNTLKKFKRVHINKHFVILFNLKKDINTIMFYRYAHHDEVYK